MDNHSRDTTLQHILPCWRTISRCSWISRIQKCPSDLCCKEFILHLWRLLQKMRVILIDAIWNRMWFELSLNSDLLDIFHICGFFFFLSTSGSLTVWSWQRVNCCEDLQTVAALLEERCPRGILYQHLIVHSTVLTAVLHPAEQEIFQWREKTVHPMKDLATSSHYSSFLRLSTFGVSLETKGRKIRLLYPQRPRFHASSTS